MNDTMMWTIQNSSAASNNPLTLIDMSPSATAEMRMPTAMPTSDGCEPDTPTGEHVRNGTPVVTMCVMLHP